MQKECTVWTISSSQDARRWWWLTWMTIFLKKSNFCLLLFSDALSEISWTRLWKQTEKHTATGKKLTSETTGEKKNGVTLKMGLCIREEFAPTLSAPLYWHFSEACQAAVIATYQLSSLALLDHNVPVAKLGHNIICTSKHPHNFHLHTREVREAKL